MGEYSLKKTAPCCELDLQENL